MNRVSLFGRSMIGATRRSFSSPLQKIFMRPAWLVHPTPTSHFVSSKTHAVQAQMAARNRVVTPLFVYRRSFNHCPYMTSQIECRGISGFGVGANWNVARCTHYTVYSKMHAKFYKVDFALASAQASGHCNGCRAGKSSLMRSLVPNSSAECRQAKHNLFSRRSSSITTPEIVRRDPGLS